ncbi:MAG TPA: ABC transporter ATP-binding protein [Candidatus Dormibacteraeota bacterium]|nr:ABC transporter ATP-binding protein [Candidatus Dormibacteraeota bacterium]
MSEGPQPPDPRLAIEARGLRKVFRRGSIAKVAVDRVDMRVGEGRIVGLIGPNGAGKSTLISMLATVMRPTSGDAWVMRHDVVREPRAARGALSLNAFAGERGFYWRLDALHNLEFFAALQGLDRQTTRRRVADVLERVGLAEDARLRFGEFSSGMKRRLNVARALLVRRPVYLFDEPTSGVDPHSAETIRSILRDLKAAGRTVVLVTHNMAEATELCDEVGMLYAGRLIRQDSPEVLRRHVPASEVEVELAEGADTAGVTARLLGLPAVVEVREQGAGRLRVRTADPERDVRGLLLWAATDSLPVAGVSVVRPELAEAFVHLVEEATGEAPDGLVSSLGAPPDASARQRRARGFGRMRTWNHP